MYYLKPRYYDPETGRFINADAFVSTGQGIIGYNMFAYCNNNPVRFKDSQGRIIELADEATEEEREQYQKAIDYLKTSETGAALIDRLESSDEVFKIIFVYDNNTEYNIENKTISFDIYSGMGFSEGKGVQSPALGLLHEMGHAAQDLDGILFKVNPEGLFGKLIKLSFESHNTLTYEIPAAIELGEPSRENYREPTFPVRMRNSTDRVLGSTRTRKNQIDLWM